VGRNHVAAESQSCQEQVIRNHIVGIIVGGEGVVDKQTVCTVYVLYTYCVRTVYVLCTYWVHTLYVLGTYFVRTGYVLGTYWVRTGYRRFSLSSLIGKRPIQFLKIWAYVILS